jgi:hypothetical protein
VNGMALITRGGKSEYDNLKAALNVFGDEYITELSKQLIQLDKVASGKLLRSLEYKVIEKVQGQFEIIIRAQDYLKWVDEGRKPGTPPPYKAILSWVEVRRIRFTNKKGNGFLKKEQTAFIISRSIGKKGIKKTDILKKTLGNVLNLKSKIVKNGAKLDIEELVNSIMQQPI